MRYFAYGSNLATAEGFVGPARLEGYRLELTRRSIRWGAGVLDIVATPGSHVWGALYEVEDLAALDAKEGVGIGAYRRIEVELHDGQRATAYEVIDKEPEPIPPAPEYAALVLAGARERGLPEEWHSELRALLGNDRDD